MILSVSRRTDIAAWYSQWFFQRLKEEYVFVRNPYRFHDITDISLSPKVVDGLVIWTKNPLPLMGRLQELEKYPYYIQYTLTSYERDVEGKIPPKGDALIPAFQKLGKTLGKERVIWRYDPVFFNSRYTPHYHLKYFRLFAQRLEGYTNRCTLSFLDRYPHIRKNLAPLSLKEETAYKKRELLFAFQEIAKKHGMALDLCCEERDFGDFPRARCIDSKLLEKISGYPIFVKQDKNQRPHCQCSSSIDIGMYNSCPGGCRYCYATGNLPRAQRNLLRHNPFSPLLLGEPGPDDTIRKGKVSSLKQGQLSFFSEDVKERGES